MRLAVLLAALAGAALLPAGPPGVGVAVVAVLVAAAVATSARPRPATVLFGSLALALASLAVLRDAAWVVALDLLGAGVLAAAAVAGPRLSALLEPARSLRDAPSLVPDPPESSPSIVRGALLGAVVVAPFGALFWSADAVFAELGSAIPVPSLESAVERLVVFVLVAAPAAGLVLTARRAPRSGTWRRMERLAPWEWALPLVLLDALFLVFVSVQLLVLFGGSQHVLRTAGLTYAEYAHQGFWQLAAAAALTLAVVGASIRLAQTPDRRHRLVLRGLLGLLCALTLVIVASVLQRLQVYEDAYGLTRLRFAVDVFALWLGGCLCVVLAAGVLAPVRRRLGAIVLAGTAAWVLAFSLANPDGIVARHNVERFEATGKIDVAYLGGLSADAVPALTSLAGSDRAEALGPIARRLEDGDPWSSWNLSRSRARAALGH